MNEKSLVHPLCLGVGGSKPGLRMLWPGADSSRIEIELPVVHSVYSIDVDVERDLIAIGTRAGRIELFSYPRCENESCERLHSLLQGAPVLSVCVLPDQRILSADTTGRVLLWSPFDNPASPVSLDTAGELIGSINRLDETHAAGLSSQGKILIWEPSTGRLLRILSGPTPPKQLALVNLVSWPSPQALVYPAADGSLVRYKPGDSSVRVWEAHHGGFYACLCDGDYLHTIGHNDGQMKTWDATGTFIHQRRCPTGIVAGEFMVDGTNRLLLINDQGHAMIYDLHDEALQPVQKLEGEAYRTVAGPSHSVRQTLAAQWRGSRFQQLKTEIQSKMDRNQVEGLTALHQELVNLGFETVSLAFRARQAAQRQDPIEELKIRRRLTSQLSSEDPQASDSLRCYADTLERTWRLQEARSVYHSIHESRDVRHSLPWLELACGAMEGDLWTIEPDIPFPLLIEAANALEEPFTGRWLFNSSNPIPFPESTLSAAVLAEKYEQIKADDQQENLPGAEPCRMQWIVRNTIQPFEAVIFHDSIQPESVEIQRALLLIQNEFQIRIQPVALFHAEGIEPGRSWRAHNAHVLRVYESVSQRQAEDFWSPKIRQTIGLALRRLRNLSLSSQRQERIA